MNPVLNWILRLRNVVCFHIFFLLLTKWRCVSCILNGCKISFLYKFAHMQHISWKFSCLPSLSRLDLVGESVLSIKSSEKVTSISLPPIPPYHSLEFKLEVLCVIPSGSDQPNIERLTNGEVRHRPRSYSHPDTPMTAIDQRVCFILFMYKDFWRN